MLTAAIVTVFMVMVVGMRVLVGFVVGMCIVDMEGGMPLGVVVTVAAKMVTLPMTVPGRKPISGRVVMGVSRHMMAMPAGLLTKDASQDLRTAPRQPCSNQAHCKVAEGHKDLLRGPDRPGARQAQEPQSTVNK